MSKILFVLFQGGAQNLKSCWSDTESDFLGKLKKLNLISTEYIEALKPRILVRSIKVKNKKVTNRTILYQKR